MSASFYCFRIVFFHVSASRLRSVLRSATIYNSLRSDVHSITTGKKYLNSKLAAGYGGGWESFLRHDKQKQTSLSFKFIDILAHVRAGMGH